MQLLDPSALLDHIRRVLPSTRDEAGESSSAPHIRDRQDALTVLTHAILSKLGFRLTGLTDEGAVQRFDDNRLPSQWSASGPGSYTFRYAHEQSSLTFLVKIVSMGARLMIHATALESNKTESYEVELERFTSRNFWPWPSSSTTGQSEPLVNGYVSSSRIADFVFGFQAKIVQKLVPGLRKEGYEEVTDADQGSSSGPSASSSSSSRQPPSQPWRPSHDPDDDYPHNPLRDPRTIGDRDLNPLGAGRMGGTFAPPPLFGGPGGRFPGGDDGGGMYVGPNHPIFRDRFQRPTPDGNFGPGGGIVPPGARFDPVTPFGGAPNRPPNIGGPLGPSGRGPPRRNLGDPDWDEMPPPGNNVSRDEQ